MSDILNEKESRRSRETAERYMVDANKGLSIEQVHERVDKGLVNQVEATGGKTIWQIISQNLLSFFNILLYIIAIAMIAVQYYSGLFFMVILAANSGIGLVQDFRARHQLKKLQIVAASRAKVIRDGERTEVLVSELVLDDIIILKTGDQIPADSVLVEGSLKVNESLLTGESNNIQKDVGGRLLGGSYVTSGTCKAQIDRVADDSYVNKLQEKAKVFKRPKSKLLAAMNNLFRVIGVIVIVLGIVMIVKNAINGVEITESVKAISGSLVSMIPSGMYLLTSMTLAVAVINLAKKNTLVQESYAVEMLARVDVLCIDKTGTITDGSMTLKEVVPINDADVSQIPFVMGSFFRVTQDESSTTKALKEAFPENNLYLSDNYIPFSSDRKNSAVTFEGIGTYVLGASSFVLDKKDYEEIREIEEEYMEKGLRVLVVAHSKKPIKDGQIPKKVKPIAFFVIRDRIRPYVGGTFEWFKENGVQIKVLSGDHPSTVGEVCRQVGVFGAEHPVNLADKSDEEVAQLALMSSVFGRVSPDQKDLIVNALQADGKTVAMVGDGVNDILALKNADCSISMGNGSEATRSVAHMVLLDNDFNALPEIVKEGRRVINNLQRTWSLFLVKTFFAMMLTILFLFTEEPYPFTTNNMYIWEIATIGVPAFFLSMQPNYNKVEGTFHSNVTRRAVPGAVVMVLTVLTYFIMASFEERFPGSTNIVGGIQGDTAITMAVITMSAFSFVILFRVCWPFNKYRLILFSALLVGAVLLLLFVGLYRPNEIILEQAIFGINFRSLESRNILEIIIVLVAAIGLYWVMDRAFAYPLRSNPRSNISINEGGNENAEN